MEPSMMKQLHLRLSKPLEFDVDGLVDRTHGVKLIGKALEQFDGTYICLADVHGALCRVEVRLSCSDRASDGPLV
jgi:hypothetical protein